MWSVNTIYGSRRGQVFLTKPVAEVEYTLIYCYWDWGQYFVELVYHLIGRVCIWVILAKVFEQLNNQMWSSVYLNSLKIMRVGTTLSLRTLSQTQGVWSWRGGYHFSTYSYLNWLRLWPLTNYHDLSTIEKNRLCPGQLYVAIDLCEQFKKASYCTLLLLSPPSKCG